MRGELKGVVVVVPLGGPIEAALATYGPALLGAGALLLVVGTLGVMFFVLAPARRRLGSLERAAAALGAGDTTARERREADAHKARVANGLRPPRGAQASPDAGSRPRHVLLDTPP